MKKRRVWPIWAGIIAVLAIGGVSFGLLYEAPAPEYSTVKVERQTLEVSVAANGQLADELTYSLAAGVDPIVSQTAIAISALPTPIQALPGYTIDKVFVSRGDVVEKDQRLIRLETPTGQTEIVRAPADGTIRTLKAIEGLPATGELLTLGSGRLLAVVRVSEYDVADLSVSQLAEVNIDALGKVFDAKVVEIGQQADGSTGVQRYAVLLELENLTQTARLGMSANAKIIIQALAATLSIPANAIANLDGKNVVARITSEGVVEPIEISIGTVGDTLVEVVSGLSENDEVVVGKIGEIPEVSSQFGPPPGVRQNQNNN